MGSPLPDEREVFLLGVLIGHLDSAGANRDEVRQFPHGGPTAKTVAYMVRRAERLLRFLREAPGLSEERRALLAPLVAGSMVRTYCADSERTLAFRLGMQDDGLQGRSDLVRRVWSEAGLAIPVLKWAFEWLRSHGEDIEGTLAHLKHFLRAGDAEVVLALLPDLLAKGVRWTGGYSEADMARDLQANPIFDARRGEILRLFARFPVLPANELWIWNALGTPEANEPEVVSFVTPYIKAQAQSGEWEAVMLTVRVPALRAIFLDALVAARPQGMRVKQWRAIAERNYLELLFPALLRMEMLPAVAELLWEERTIREEWIRLGGEEKWVGAFAPAIRDRAEAEDFEFAAQLPPLGRSLFFRELAASEGDALWSKLAALGEETVSLFAADLGTAPLSDGFWAFVSGAANGGKWIDAVGRERAEAAFARLPAPVIRALLESDWGGLESLMGAWIQGHAGALQTEEPLLVLAATHLSEEIRAPALARLRQLPLNLRVALRLMESGLPEAQGLARPYFEAEGDEWAMRVLALADSPVVMTRNYGLELLARFPARWTPDLLQSLAQHDDSRVQAFVARQLGRAPEIAGTEAIAVFDSAILNSRGRARRAKVGVQRRLETQTNEEQAQLESLLDAARSGTAHDRAWALQQLVRLQLSGTDIPELHLSGAVARSSS